MYAHIHTQAGHRCLWDMSLKCLFFFSENGLSYKQSNVGGHKQHFHNVRYMRHIYELERFCFEVALARLIKVQQVFY